MSYVTPPEARCLSTQLRTRASGLLALTVALAAFVSTDANAAAYYLGEVGTRSLARGGANIVNSGDPTAVWLNPAAITQSSGLQLQLNNTVVWLNSSFVRDCGGDTEVYCGPTAVNRSYGAQQYQVNPNRDPSDDNSFFAPNTPDGPTLGRRGTPSRFGDADPVRNQSPPQYIPAFFATLNLDSIGLDGFAVGGGIFGPNAGDYRYGDDEATRYTLIDRDLFEAYYMVTLAYAFKDLIAVGASLQGVTAGLNQDVRLSADLYGNENPDYDIGINIEAWQHFIPSANFGVWSNPFLGLELGASVQLGRKVQASGPLSFNHFGDEVALLLEDDGNGPPLIEIIEDNPTATVNFTMPPFYRAGIKYGEQDLFDGLFGFDLELDFVYEQWSVFDAVQIAADGVAFSTSGGEPTALEPIIQPKNYNDSWSVRLGGEVNFFERMLQLRGGTFYETAAIPNETLSVELLNGQKLGVGVGGSVEYFGLRFDVGYAHMFTFQRVVGQESIVHNENVAPQFGGNLQTRIAMGTYDFSYDILTVAVNVKFDEMFGFGKVEKAPWERGFVPYFGQYWTDEDTGGAPVPIAPLTPVPEDRTDVPGEDAPGAPNAAAPANDEGVTHDAPGDARTPAAPTVSDDAQDDAPPPATDRSVPDVDDDAPAPSVPAATTSAPGATAPSAQESELP